ncbi:MAG TPA: alpha/beta hydrolase [Candidatus Cottocaccamicrobium excrementipullorum]|nr:alpha/beta hydrolase [Candidatus Cottocaccamicrobium excrementipullorum]
MVEKWKITIPELTGDEERGVYVYLPESYGYHDGRRYPVLYMFDGHNVFFDSDATYGKCWGMKEYMDFTQSQVIIAAVECNHSPDHGRLKEYSPYDFQEKGVGKISGKGNITMDWMSQTFKPLIDSRYRTIPDRAHTWIGGSSMGGLMSLYGVLAYSHVYSRAAALSPSLWTNPREIEALIRRSPAGKDTVIYMDYGQNELASGRQMEKLFSRINSLLLEKKICLTSRIVPGGTHCEASWEKQLPFMMHTLTYH